MDDAIKLKEIEDLLLTLSEEGTQDVATIQQLKDKHRSLSARLAAHSAAAVAPSAAVGAPTRGGSQGKAGDLRAAGAVALTAPAKAGAGLVDLGITGGAALDKMLGTLPPDFEPPSLSRGVDDLTNALAGRPVERSILRSAVEGAAGAPLTGVRGVSMLPALFAGAAGGAAGEAVSEKGGHPAAAFLASLLAGYGAGGAAQLLNRTPAEVVATGRLQRAMGGLSEKDLRSGAAAHAEARREGFQLLPSQALPDDAAGLQRLQGELLASRAANAEPFRSRVTSMPGQAREQLARVQNAGGQTPRTDAELAERLKRVAGEAQGDARRQINAATKADYEAPLATRTHFKANLAKDVRAHFDDAIDKARGSALEQAALAKARDSLVELLDDGLATPAQVLERLREVRNSLPTYADPGLRPQDSNRLRAVVLDATKPLEELVFKTAPSLAKAQSTQADLRSALLGQFEDIARQQRAGGNAATAVNAAAQRPQVVAELVKRDPQVAQELLQRTVNEAVEKALGRSKITGTHQPSGVIGAKVELTEGPAGKVLQTYLPHLFRHAPDPAAAAEGFNRVLRVVANASREPGSAFVRHPVGTEVAARVLGGSHAQQISEGGRQVGGLLQNFRDKAAIKVLEQPDVMERLIYLSKLPPGRVTQATIISALPQLFEGEQ